MAFWTVLLKFWNQFAKPIFIAHHESHGRVVALNEVVEVQWLALQEEIGKLKRKISYCASMNRDLTRDYHEMVLGDMD